ncbi:MAG: radical SAM protein [Nitrospinota bacterium]
MAKVAHDFEPAYLALKKRGELRERVKALRGLLRECTLCARSCRVDRTVGALGVCEADDTLTVSSVFPHFGEEPPLVGRFGSGTIFLTHCNLRCAFCQNWDISHGGKGQRVTLEEVAEAMIWLQRNGCHNINFVTPTHYAPLLVEAVDRATELGLRLPIVWNCGGYESLEALRLLEGIVDIYMPDIKFAGSEPARKYLKAPDYPEVARDALREMHRQVGDLEVVGGVALRGLLVRHLVMPQDLAGSAQVMEFLAGLSPDTYVNIMDQYRPCYQAGEFPELSRRITGEEFGRALEAARNAGLRRGFERGYI